MNDPTPKRRARLIARGLARLYPDARCSLDYQTPLQLLIATILSAQCTDVRVNMITPALFARYPDAAAFASADLGDIETLIQSTGFFRNKAKNIQQCCQQILEQHGGEVPSGMEELTALAGVGRKTANVVRGNGFGIPGLPVDTHVGRLSQRMGLTTNTDPVRIETDLAELVPKSAWTKFSLRMIYHGRQVCHARKPLCEECALAKVCAKEGVGRAETSVALSAPAGDPGG